MIYWIIGVLIVLSLVVRVLYIIGKNVKKHEAKINAQVKKDVVDAKRKKKAVNYARKSTPKVPSNGYRPRKNK